MASFWKTEACGQTVLPDRSVLIGQKVVENVKIVKFKCDILSNFQTLVLLKVVGSNYDHVMANILLKKLKIICQQKSPWKSEEKSSFVWINSLTFDAVEKLSSEKKQLGIAKKLTLAYFLQLLTKSTSKNLTMLLSS